MSDSNQLSTSFYYLTVRVLRLASFSSRIHSRHNFAAGIILCLMFLVGASTALARRPDVPSGMVVDRERGLIVSARVFDEDFTEKVVVRHQGMSDAYLTLVVFRDPDNPDMTVQALYRRWCFAARSESLCGCPTGMPSGVLSREQIKALAGDNAISADNQQNDSSTVVAYVHTGYVFPGSTSVDYIRNQIDRIDGKKIALLNAGFAGIFFEYVHSLDGERGIDPTSPQAQVLAAATDLFWLSGSEENKVASMIPGAERDGNAVNGVPLGMLADDLANTYVGKETTERDRRQLLPEIGNLLAMAVNSHREAGRALIGWSECGADEERCKTLLVGPAEEVEGIEQIADLPELPSQLAADDQGGKPPDMPPGYTDKPAMYRLEQEINKMPAENQDKLRKSVYYKKIKANESRIEWDTSLPGRVRGTFIARLDKIRIDPGELWNKPQQMLRTIYHECTHREIWLSNNTSKPIAVGMNIRKPGALLSIKKRFQTVDKDGKVTATKEQFIRDNSWIAAQDEAYAYRQDTHFWIWLMDDLSDPIFYAFSNENGHMEKLFRISRDKKLSAAEKWKRSVDYIANTESYGSTYKNCFGKIWDSYSKFPDGIKFLHGKSMY